MRIEKHKGRTKNESNMRTTEEKLISWKSQSIAVSEIGFFT